MASLQLGASRGVSLYPLNFQLNPHWEVPNQSSERPFDSKIHASVHQYKIGNDRISRKITEYARSYAQSGISKKNNWGSL